MESQPLTTNDRDESVPLTGCEIFKEEVVLVKWRILALCCCLTFGSYYIYDFPGSIGTGESNTIQSKFNNHGKSYTQGMNQALYSVYSWPNTFLAFFGGLLIDKFLGLRRALLLFTTLVMAGSALFYVGVITTSYPLLICGRLLFGFGGESLSVAQSAFVARWFRNGRGMALAFGITISFSRVGSSFNFLFSTKIAAASNIDVAVLCGTLACVFSWVVSMLVIACDKYGERKGLVPAESKEVSDPFHPRQLKELSASLWLLCGICVCCYCAIFPFVGIAENFFEVKYNVNEGTASTYVSVYQFTCAGGSALIGLGVDYVGRFVAWIMMAGVGFVGIHLLFITTSVPAFAMMAIMGVLYSFLASSLWPSVPYAVREDFVGTAYGIMTAMQNAGLAIVPLISGAILDAHTPNAPTVNVTGVPPVPNMTPAPTTGAPPAPTPLPDLTGYKLAELVFMAAAGCSVALTVILFIVDMRAHKLLSSSSVDRKLKQAELLKLEAAVNDEKEQKL